MQSLLSDLEVIRFVRLPKIDSVETGLVVMTTLIMELDWQDSDHNCPSRKLTVICKTMNRVFAKARMVVRAHPLAVFNAFVDAETMSKFWFTRRDEGLQEGKTVSWFVGQAEDAYAIEVNVVELRRPDLIRIEWWGGKHFTQVLWQIQQTDDGYSNLTIEESGFKGTKDEIVSSALDSTGGFNQVIVALKALLEHEAIINVVDDHT